MFIHYPRNSIVASIHNDMARGIDFQYALGYHIAQIFFLLDQFGVIGGIGSQD